MHGRWQQIGQIFHQASELAGPELAGFLDHACNGDLELRHEVESLLAADGHGQQLFGQAVERVVETIPDDGSMEGQSVGPYIIEHEVGRGGMGAVYLAHRQGDFSKRVAIKLVKRGMDTDQIVSRFRQERQILANLEHPNIARLLDGGATEDGRPYLVMEYVEGKPITRYSTRDGLSLPDTLALFLQVCDGVLCAHRNLVIHRDLKPGNILVNSDGVVKLLDFGIAKLLDTNADGETAPRTMVGTPLLTPDYASPEQVRGMAVSVSTDVYSLGAVLYELLTGRPPHRFESLSAAEIERVICEGAIPPPGIGSRELDSIVAMALRKEPERRYASVEQFAEDVRRFLDGRPVLAHPDSWSYRAGRWMRRHRTAAIAAAIAICSLLTGLGVALYQAQVARQHAARAERRFNEVRKLARSILLEHYELIRELPGATRAKESMAKVSQEYLNSLAGEADDPVLILELANAHRRLAEVQGAPGEQNLGQTALATENFRKAIRLLDRLPPGQWNNPKVLDSAVASMRRLSRLLQHEGKVEEAARLVERQVKLARELYAKVPDNPNVAVQYITVHRELAILALRRDDIAAAVKYAEEALQVAANVVAANPHPIIQAERVNIYPVYADAVWKQGDLPRVERLYEDFLAAMAQLSAQNPDNRYFIGLRQFGHYSLGRLHSSFLRINLGNADKAERNCRIYLDWYRGALRTDPSDAKARENVIHASLCTGTAVAMRRPNDALPYLEDAVRRAQDEARRETTLRTRTILAYTLLVLAEVQSQARRNGAARETFEKALAMYDAMEKEERSSGENTDAMLANRQYSRLTRDAGRARKAVGMTRGDGLPQAIVHAAEARQVLAEVSPADRCTALHEAASLWEKARAFTFTAALAEKRLQGLASVGCAKP